MTITFLQPDSVPATAQQERQGSAAVYGGGSGRPLGGRSGFRVGTPSNILTATSTTWTLVPCSAQIDPGASTHQGMYGWASDANVTGAVTAADATYARKDIVYIQVNDSSAGDGSGATSAPVLYAEGTPSATPVAPDLTGSRARSFLVGTITVPKATAGSPTVVLNPARFVAAGGILPVSSQSEQDALTGYKGLTVRRLDLAGQPLLTHDGATFQSQLPQSEWTFSSAGVPSVSVWGSNTLTNDAAASTDTAFITTPGPDLLTIRDAGLYAIHVSGTWSNATTGRAFTQLTDAGATTVHARSSAAAGENVLSTGIPNFKCAAGTVIKLTTYLTLASGTTTWAGRVRVTRIG